MSTWTVEGKSNCAEKCSYAEGEERSLIFDDAVWSVVKELCEKIGDEWQMMLIGKKVEDDIIITDYMIPKQTVSRASVTNDDAITKEMIDELGIIATIHSHSDMNVFFSSTDMRDTNMSLIDYHVVVNNKHETTGAYKLKLPCGMLGMGKLVVKRYVDDVKLEIKGLENIKKQTAVHWEREYYDERPSYPPLSKSLRKKWDAWRKPWSKDDEIHIGKTLMEQGGV